MVRRKTKKKVFTVTDVQRAGFLLEPIICPHCHVVGEVHFDQAQLVGFCQICGHINPGRSGAMAAKRRRKR